MNRYEFDFSSPEQKAPYQTLLTSDPDAEKQDGMERIMCSNCALIMKYKMQPSVYLIKCPVCSTATAIKPLGKLKCGKCKIIMCYPIGSKYVKCTCGVINEVPAE